MSDKPILIVLDRFQEIQKIRTDLECAKLEVKELSDHLEQIEACCTHIWGDPIRDDIIRPAGSNPGDAPGTMGVDWRGSCSWPERKIRCWKRACKRCGKEECTTNHKPTGDVVPIF